MLKYHRLYTKFPAKKTEKFPHQRAAHVSALPKSKVFQPGQFRLRVFRISYAGLCLSITQSSYA